MPAENTCEIVVETVGPGGSTYVLMDHNNRAHRVWLAKHAFWAMRNDRALITQPAHMADALAVNTARRLS